jgi:uncharacterized protein
VIHSIPGGVALDVRVIPRSPRPGVAGTRAGALLVRLQSPPVEGAANEELVEVIARTLGVRRRDVSVVAGERSRQKRVHVVGVDVRTAETRLAGSQV